MENKPKEKNSLSLVHLNKLVKSDPILFKFYQDYIQGKIETKPIKEPKPIKILEKLRSDPEFYKLYKIECEHEAKKRLDRIKNARLSNPERFSHPASCMVSRARIGGVIQSPFYTDRREFIKKYPVLNPSPPEKK